MSGENGWAEHKLHVLSEIQDLKDSSKEHGKLLQEINGQLSGMRSSQKWETRILSAFWGLVVLGINLLIGKHE